MQVKQTAVRLLLIVLPLGAYSQTTYIDQGDKQNTFIERMEILNGRDSILNFSKTRPYSRKQFIPALEKLDSSRFSRVDRWNWYTTRLNNLEWISDRTGLDSRKPILKAFYKTPATLLEVTQPDFFLSVNPIVRYTEGKEQNNGQHIFNNTRGAVMRGRIANKIGFAATITDNQERDPLYVQRLKNERDAVPGAGFVQDFKVTGYDYFDARGYITFNATRYIDLQFGYDRNFIGNGFRSMFLDDAGAPYLFLKINTRIWKLNYQNLFMELTSANKGGVNTLYPKKYASIHHLDIAATKWLNLGLYEAVIFGRKDHFEFGYLNPVIFYRSAEQQNGSLDNSLAGFDAKANVARHFQFYTQFMLDEFSIKEIRRGSGWWGNKWAWQLGGKYIDAFGIHNLDLQLESNRVRPFTYSHTDSVANFTHYNQPLGPIQGANYQEFIGQARYQPAPRWMVELKGIYYNQGKDVDTANNGSNILLPNAPPYRVKDFGFGLPSGVPVKTALLSGYLSYELRPNLFLEGNAVYRKESSTIPAYGRDSWIIYAGVRWNISRRTFEF